MTLIIGIKCSDGIVLGADGAATMGAMGQSTIRQAINRKIVILENCIAVGVSGPVGLGQRFRGEVQQLWKDNKLAGGSHKVMTNIRQAIWKHISQELRAARASQPILGPGIASQSALASMVIALPIAKEPALLEFNHQGAPEEAADVPFVAIGSGQLIADPFLAFIKRIFWGDDLPSINQGIFAALWTLQHAILTSPGGVSDPKQMIVLRKEGGSCRAQELSQVDLQEHYEAIAGAEGALARFRDSLAATGSQQAADIPEP